MKKLNTPSKFREIIEKFPAQFSASLQMTETSSMHGPFSSTIICGMGGSALAGEILKGWLNLEKRSYKINIWRNYDLPYFADKTSLFICVSYSGNTEETLSAFQTARAIGAQIVSVSAGGTLESLARTYHIPHVHLPEGIPPRMSTGYMFNALFLILEKARILPAFSYKVQKLSKSLNIENWEDKAKTIARKIDDKIPLIYSAEEHLFLAYNLKIKLNENNKIHAFCNYLPEMNHNELVGFTLPQGKNPQGKFHALFIEDEHNHPQIRKRILAMKKILKEKGYSSDSIKTEGSDNLEKIFGLSIFGDLLSYYIAQRSKIDPLPVDIVEDFKKQIKNS